MFYKETNFKETPIGKIPKDWKIKNLGEVLQEVELRAKEISDYKNLPVLSLTKDLGLIPQEERFIKRVATIDVSEYKVVKKGWLVYNPYVIWEGAIHVLKEKEIGLVSPVYVVWKPTAIDYSFLDHLIRTKYMLNTFFRLSTGAVQRRRAINKKTFQKILIQYPQFLEQQKISEILSTIDEAIQKTDEVIATTERLKKGLMQELLTKGIGHKEFKNTKIGRIPKGWEVVKLKDVILEAKPGFACGKRDENGILQLRMDSIETQGWINVRAGVKVPIPENVDEYLLKPGDILFNNTNSADLIGKTAIFKGEFPRCVYSNHLTRIRVNPQKVLPEWILYIFIRNWQLGIFKAIRHQHVHQAGINQQDLLNLKIPITSLTEQQKIAEILSTVDKKLKVERKEKERLVRIKQGLMDLLLTGKVRVKVASHG